MILRKLFNRNTIIIRRKLKPWKPAHHATTHYRRRVRIAKHLRRHSNGWKHHYIMLREQKVESLLHRMRRLFVKGRS